MSRDATLHTWKHFGRASAPAAAVRRKREQTAKEELLNVITHGIGAILGGVGTLALLGRALAGGSVLAAVSVLCYGMSLIFLYTTSAVYHGTRTPVRKQRMRILDHCSIYLLILGSYIPIALVKIGGALGWLLCIVNGTLAAIGIISLIGGMRKGKHKMSVVLYLVMGWLALLALEPVVHALPDMGVALLIAGGISYTAGVYFYKKNGLYMHVIWHLFVMAGSALHYLCILLYCCG